MNAQDAAWLLPSSSPLKCTSPADVYILLKSSDFVTHDLSARSVFDGCGGGGGSVGGNGQDQGQDQEEEEEKAYTLELVLRKWFAIDPSREMRAFVRDGVLIGTGPCIR
jgi:D123